MRFKHLMKEANLITIREIIFSFYPNSRAYVTRIDTTRNNVPQWPYNTSPSPKSPITQVNDHREGEKKKLTYSFALFTGFPAAAYAAYAASRGYSGYPSFGLPYPTGNHLSLNHLNHHNAAHIAPLNLNLNLIQAQPAPHHNPPTPTPLFYHPNLDLYNAMPL